MACQAMYRWSLIGLVAAFLDLAIVYFLLCASSITFMATKFLGLFGLYLPCPSCYGLFGADSNRNLCLHKLLIEYPAEKVSNVQVSVMSKFPFNASVWGKDHNCNLNLRLIGDGERDVVELEGEASCSSLSDGRKSNNMKNSRNEIEAINSLGVRDGRFDLKGKGIMHQRPRSGIRRRRKGNFDYGKYTSVSSYDPFFREVQGDPHSPSGINKRANEFVEDNNIELQDCERDRHHCSKKALSIMRLGHRSSNILESNEFADEDEHVKELTGNVQSGLNFSSDDRNTIRLLEQALEEEHAAHAALYVELEKERNAAASAADEAMAMIQRLQEEKASIEMEARQYHRMIEEKSAYDAEEMNILKEIIVRREREKHFLEKEVEAYRQISYTRNEQPSGNGADMLSNQHRDFGSSFDPNEDPELMLHQLSASIDKKVMIENQIADEVMSINKEQGIIAPLNELTAENLDENCTTQTQGHPAGYLAQFSLCSNGDSWDLQDKMISMDNNFYGPSGNLQRIESSSQSCKPGSSKEKLLEKTTTLVGKGHESCDNVDILAETAKNSRGTKSSCYLFDKEPHVHDVHVIVNQSNLCNQVDGSKLERISMNCSSEVHRRNCVTSEASAFPTVSAASDYQSISHLDAEVDIRRSSSDITGRLPPICPRGKSLLSDLRKNSLSVVDSERLKIDYEVGWLQERLRVVQEGREKLHLSVEHREREKVLLKLLENIANQLQEIRQLTEAGKVVRQTSLPPPSSKVISKKRRSRSVSSTLQISS
ncbi:hypothetical protein ACH5RR_031775 [Cinchona calisaya]|uniref:GTD-binding domain-containing protein n=1 Tax=Cinchona calisaya TaxID=153742 RepID=A0ABD2YH94_9GENT